MSSRLCQQVALIGPSCVLSHTPGLKDVSKMAQTCSQAVGAMVVLFAHTAGAAVMATHRQMLHSCWKEMPSWTVMARKFVTVYAPWCSRMPHAC